MRSSRQKALQQVVALSLMMTAFSWGSVEAVPEGGIVRSGDADISKQNQTLVIDQHSQRVALDWNTFDIAKGETVRFIQQKSDIALNRVIGNKASEIYGSLQADGTVLLLNPHGVLFGQGAQVDVGSLVASTAQVDDSFMTGSGDSVEAISLKLGEASDGKVINAGDIQAQGGLVAMHASVVENTGSIVNEGGKIALSAAKNLNLSIDSAKKINFEATGEVVNAHVLNTGIMQANGGHVLMTAKSAGDMLSEVVNNEGIIEAKTASINDQGEILLDGGDHGTVNVSGTLDASGLEAGQSGGIVRVLGENTIVKDGAKLTASGDKDGGLVETSGDVLDVSTKADIEASGRTGKAGEWLLDPVTVYITNTPGSYTNITADATDAGSFTGVANSNGTDTHSYVSADYISWLLSKGTNVSVEARDVSITSGDKHYNAGVSNIIVTDDIVKFAPNSDNVHYNNIISQFGSFDVAADNNTTLKLKAEQNVAVNANITADAGALNIELHADSNNDKKGMVIINGNITTNGGDLTAGCGTEMATGNTGIYFGNSNSSSNSDLTITTKGGSVKLYGDVALGLNKGNLLIDTKDGAGEGNIEIGGNVDSANAYRLFVNDYAAPDSGTGLSDAAIADINSNQNGLKELAKNYYENYLKEVAWKTFAELTDTEYEAIKNRCFTLYEVYKNRVRPAANSVEEKQVVEAYFNDYVKLLGKVNVTPISTNFDDIWAVAGLRKQLSKNILTNWSYDKTNNRESILTNWENAIVAAKEGTAGGSGVGDKYLATVTTELENWIVSTLLAGSRYEAFLGGVANKVTGENNKVIREFKWKTGPEGMANNGDGTLFFTSEKAGEGTVAPNMYAGWSHDAIFGQFALNEPNDDKTQGEPYVAIQWRSDSGWVDVSNLGKLVVGFVQETNTEHSNIKLLSDSGTVKIGGNIGESAALGEVDIQTNGTVKIGGGQAHSADVLYTGQVFSDGKVNIVGNAGVEVGDRITSTAGGVNINSQGNVTTKGVTAKDKVHIITTGDNKTITMGANIVTASTAKDAVIIDAGNGKFVNNSIEDNGIVTGTGGSWKVYFNAPGTDTFGTNLDSGTYALWNRGSADYAYTAVQADDAAAVGRYIFRVQPTITFTAEDKSKTYGDEAQNIATWTVSAKALDTDVLTYKGVAFDETDVLNAAKTTGIANSAGFAATANVGEYAITMSANNQAFGQTDAVAHGYNPVVSGASGKLTVNPRPLNVGVELSGTYGSGVYTKTITADNLVNGDKIVDAGYTLLDSYTSQVPAGATTAPVKDDGYDSAVLGNAVTFADASDANNYTITYNNAKLTITPREVVLDLTGHGRTLDKDNIHEQGTGYAAQLVNGDTLANAPKVSYDIGRMLSGNTYGIDLSVDGNKAASGDVFGNYRFTYRGVYTVDADVERPVFEIPSFTSRTGNASYLEEESEEKSSVQQVLGLTTARLPFVKEVNGTLSSYGTYKLAVDPDKVTLEAADTSIPLPDNGTHDQYREFTKPLVTARGTADFKLSYDGSVFAIHPAGPSAEKMLEAGDAAHNVDIASQALHAAFAEMGLELEDLDAVYVCFD